ncbi:hypothetical protein KGP36_06195, partial [Patescibacteria group bacterium]|nr:hypothetical protein [Patescibacteria group bacterium]
LQTIDSNPSYPGISVGFDWNRQGSAVNGTIDDTRIYSRALSAQEVTELYNTGNAARTNNSLVGPGNLNSGLVGWWTFDGKNTDWKTGVTNDSSGSGNNGQLIGMSTSTSVVPGKIGQALKFNGTNQAVSTPSIDLSSTNKITISFWVNAPYESYNQNFFENSNNYNGNSEAFIISMNDICTGNNFEFGYSHSGYYLIDCIPYSGWGSWHQVTLVIDKSIASQNQVSAYVDGKSVSVTSTSYTSYDNNNFGNYPLYFMSRAASSAWANGSIDDTRIYSRALSAQEVQQLYNTGSAGHTNNSLVGPGNLNSGLVGWWTFDGKDTNWATGKTNDISGNGNNGQMINLSTTTSSVGGRMGQALLFNGTSQGINLGYPSTLQFDGKSAVSVSAWVKFKTAVPSGTATVLVDGETFTNSCINPAEVQYLLDTYFGNFSFGVCTSSNIWTTAQGLAPLAGRWYFIVGTYDGANERLYVNGALNATTAQTGTLTTLSGGGATGASIGYDSFRNGEFMNGIIDDVRVYGHTLSAQEVQQLYNLGH